MYRTLPTNGQQNEEDSLVEISDSPQIKKKLNLKEQNINNYSIFSYLDFENIWTSSGFIIDEVPDEGGPAKRVNGPISLSIPVSNISGLKETVKQTIINEDETGDPLEKVKIIIAINNSSNNKGEKYTVESRSLKQILNEENSVINIQNVNILGVFRFNQEPIFDINIYAQGIDSYELLDMFSFEIDYIQELLIFDLRKIRDNRLELQGELQIQYNQNVAFASSVESNVPIPVALEIQASAAAAGIGSFANSDLLLDDVTTFSTSLADRVLNLENGNQGVGAGQNNPVLPADIF